MVTARASQTDGGIEHERQILNTTLGNLTHLVFIIILIIAGIDDLNDVLTPLSDTFNQWQLLGLKLGISYTRLDRIKKEQKEMIQSCLMEMLAAWLKHMDKAVNPTWKQLIESLKGMGENDLADKIEKEIAKD